MQYLPKIGRANTVKRLSVVHFSTLLMLCSAAGSLGQTPGPYTVTNLGTLGGSESRAYSINNSGQVVGESNTATNGFRGFLYSAGAMTDVGSLGGSTSVANWINDAGQIAGDSQTSLFRGHAFLKTGPAMTDLGTLGGRNSRAITVNNQGLVGGCADTPTAVRAYLYGTTMTEITSLTGDFSCVYAINGLGHAVGETLRTDFTTHGFLYNGATTDLGTLGGRYSNAFNINGAGQIVGESSRADRTIHAFMYSGGTMNDLGTLEGSDSAAFGINSAGVIVGTSWIKGDTDVHAFIYTGGKMYDLNALLPANSGWVLNEARSINDAGQIVGTGEFNGATRGFLLDPVVVRNHPPVANAGPDVKGECAGSDGYRVRLDGSGSSDPDGDPLTYTWTGPFGTLRGAVVYPNFGLGAHTVTLTVEDGKGEKATDTLVVTTLDTGAPTLAVSLTPTVLWPANHKLIRVTAATKAADACGSATVALMDIKSNEPDNGLGDGDEPNDIQPQPDGTVLLRAERSGHGNGRIYEFTFEAKDAAGNTVAKKAQVTVPKNASGR